jgi:hypothetical protein
MKWTSALCKIGSFIESKLLLMLDCANRLVVPLACTTGSGAADEMRRKARGCFTQPIFEHNNFMYSSISIPQEPQ